MSTDLIKTTKSSKILRITFNRPDKKNALNPEMYETLIDTLNHASEDTNTRIVVFRGEERNLTSGNDLSDFQEVPDQFDTDFPPFRFIKTLASFEKPIITQVEGYAVGIGGTMLLHSDLVFAEKEAQIRFPFVDLGVVPEAASSLLLPRMAGYQQAAELLLTGDFISAQRGKEIGFVNDVVSADELPKLVRETSETLAKKPPKALMQTRKLLKNHFQDEVMDTIETEAEQFHERLNSDEAMEAMMAMMEEREPDFS